MVGLLWLTCMAVLEGKKLYGKEQQQLLLQALAKQLKDVNCNITSSVGMFGRDAMPSWAHQPSGGR